MATDFHGTAEAERLYGAIKSYVDARLKDIGKSLSFGAKEIAGQRKMILDLEDTVQKQKTVIKELVFKLGIVDNRTRKLIPNSDKPVKL